MSAVVRAPDPDELDDARVAPLRGAGTNPPQGPASGSSAHAGIGLYGWGASADRADQVELHQGATVPVLTRSQASGTWQSCGPSAPLACGHWSAFATPTSARPVRRPPAWSQPSTQAVARTECWTRVMRAVLSAVVVLAGAWALFALVLIVRRPDRATLALAARMLPDTLRLVGRLARDRTVSHSARLPLWLLLAYLALPFDLVPDILPVIGYADDAILTALVLRRLVRHAGPDKLAEHWPGTAEGLDTLRHLLRLGPAEPR